MTETQNPEHDENESSDTSNEDARAAESNEQQDGGQDTARTTEDSDEASGGSGPRPAPRAYGSETPDRNRPVDANTAGIDYSARTEVAAPAGKILEPDEEISFDGEEVGNQVIVKEDVYRKVQSPGSRRPSYVLMYRKGAVVPGTTVQRRSSENPDNGNEEEGKEG